MILTHNQFFIKYMIDARVKYEYFSVFNV